MTVSFLTERKVAMHALTRTRRAYASLDPSWIRGQWTYIVLSVVWTTSSADCQLPRIVYAVRMKARCRAAKNSQYASSQTGRRPITGPLLVLGYPGQLDVAAGRLADDRCSTMTRVCLARIGSLQSE